MNTGKQLAMRRFFRKGKTLIIALDHGLYFGSREGIENVSHLVKRISNTEADGILVSPGMLERVADNVGELAIVLRIDGTHTRLGHHLERIDLITSVENAVCLGAEMVVVNVFVGCANEDQLLRKLGEVASDCRSFGIPLMAEMIPASVLDLHYEKSHNKKRSNGLAGDIALAARVGTEIGADCIKTIYTGDKESFGRMVDSTPAPILIAGGPMSPNSNVDFLRMVREAITCGAGGAVVGRNIWQRRDMEKMTSDLYNIVHGKSAEE